MSKFGFIEPTKSKNKRPSRLKFPKRTLVQYAELQDWEFEAIIGDEVIMDIECYPNYFLIMFLHLKSNKCATFEMSEYSNIDWRKLMWCLQAFTIYTFNGNGYDVPILCAAIKGYDCQMLSHMTQQLIVEKMRTYEFFETYNLKKPYLRHIDLIEVCPLNGSLKKYAARLHAVRMQELPYDPVKSLSYDQQVEVRHYCFNDCGNTALIKTNLREQLDLRETLSAKYQIDLRSKSDAQIAEAVVAKELEKILGYKPKKPNLAEGYYCQYKDPGFISFNNPQLRDAYEKIKNARFYLDAGGSPKWPEGLGERYKNKKGDWVWGIFIRINGSVYKMGVGGLHSSEKSAAYQSNEEFIYLDRDVASYYPRIKLNQGLYPEHLTRAYLEVYDALVVARLAAKKAGNNAIADALKIVINGAFGKLGDKHSVIYSPDLMLQVTLSGQLCLLMLIDMLETNNIHVVSANTDGIVSQVPQKGRDVFENVIRQWEGITNFETEETGYHSIYSKDVNNYIAVKYKEDPSTKKQNFGKIWLPEKEVCKLKGAYSNPWPDKKAQIFRFHVNPTFQICTEAICEMLMQGTPVAHTIRQSTDITKFVSVRDVKGGGHCDSVYVGKFVRWYIGTDSVSTINYLESGNNVPETEGACPCMDLPETFPSDVDYNWYEERVQQMLIKIGFQTADQVKGQVTFF